MDHQLRSELAEILMAEDNPGDVLIAEKSSREAKTRNPFKSIKDGKEAMDYLNQRG